MNNNYGFTLLGEIDGRTPTRDTSAPAVSLNGFMQNVLNPGEGFVAYHRTGFTCRETLVQYMLSYGYRIHVLMEANLTPWIEVTASGSEDLLSGQAFRQLNPGQKAGVTSLLASIMSANSLTVVVSPDDVLTVRYMAEPYANPIKMSSVLLVLRMLKGLIEVDPEFYFAGGTFMLLASVLNNMEALKEIYPDDVKGMARVNLVLAFSAMTNMLVVTGHCYSYRSNGPATYARINFRKEDWYNILRRNSSHIEQFNLILREMEVPELRAALLEFNTKKEAL